MVCGAACSDAQQAPAGEDLGPSSASRSGVDDGAGGGGQYSDALAASDAPGAESDPLADSDLSPEVEASDGTATPAPVITVDPVAYQFSYVSPLTDILIKDIEIYNVGDAPLELSAIDFVPGGSEDFSIVMVAPLPKLLAPWDTTQVRVRFEEGDGGATTLRITSNDPATPTLDVDLSSHLKATLIVDLDLDIDGDCVTATCPTETPYPVGCNVVFSGDDTRGCVASTPTSPVVYFQEGNVCGAGHVSGTLSCSDTQGAVLGETNCPINKLLKLYPANQSGCPATWGALTRELRASFGRCARTPIARSPGVHWP